jgi:citrate synthase
MSDRHHDVTAVSKIVSTEQEEELILCGHRLSTLIREANFASSVFLMLTRRMPTASHDPSSLWHQSETRAWFL